MLNVNVDENCKMVVIMTYAKCCVNYNCQMVLITTTLQKILDYGI